MHPPAVGIDLGTTYTVLAALDDQGRPQSIANAEGELITPSVVLLGEDEIVVGREAWKAPAEEADLVATMIKRATGQRSFPQLFGGRRIPPEVLQALILRKLVRDSQTVLGPYSQVVITVPAYFDDARRLATQQAGLLAGLDVLDILNEPTAAAIAFGYQQQLLSQSQEPLNLLVYDLGGGTFDVTIMEIDGSDFNALATDGDARLGGRDWDERLMGLAADALTRQGCPDPRQAPHALQRFWRICEEAKRTLTARRKASLLWEAEGASWRVEVLRDDFEAASEDLLERTAFTTRQTLQAAGLDWGDLDYVLLVGGASRMPAVEARLRQLTGRPPQRALSPDEAVAHGAALHAGAILAGMRGARPDFQIRNVNAHSLGVAATEPVTHRARTAVVIPRNTPLPATGQRLFKTQKAGQKSILVRIVEGESPDPNECAALGRCVVRDLPPNLPPGSPVDVRFSYGADGRLSIFVQAPGAGVELSHELTRENTLSIKEMHQWRDFMRRLDNS